MALDARHFLCGEIAIEQVYPRRADQRTVPLGENLDTLCSGVCPLVILSRQILHSEASGTLGWKRIVDQIQLRFREHRADACIEQRFVNGLHIIAVEQPQFFQMGNLQQ